MDYTKFVEVDLSVEDQLVAAYAEGTKMKEIAHTFNMSMGKIYTILNARGITTRRTSYVMSEALSDLDTEDIMQLITDYETGASVMELQDKYRLHKNGVYYILDSYNIPRRKHRGA